MEEELCCVTEVGTFGELDIEDPTVTKQKKKKSELDALIEASIVENASNLTAVTE